MPTRFSAEDYDKVRSNCNLGEHCGEHGHCVGGAGVFGWCGPDQLTACLLNTDCMSGYCSSSTCTPDAPVPDNAVSDDPPGGLFQCLASGSNGDFVSVRFVGASIQENRPKCFDDASFQDGSVRPYMAYGRFATEPPHEIERVGWEGQFCFNDDPQKCSWKYS